MRINRNFLKISGKAEIKITGINSEGIKDIRFKIENEFWNEFKSDKNVLSFWFSPKEPLDKDRYFDVHYTQAPYYQLGTMYYPSGTTEPKLCKFILGNKGIPDSYKGRSFFIRFNRVDLGKTFYLTKGKLEIGDYSLYTPSISELDPSEQAIFVAEGVFQEVYPI